MKQNISKQEKRAAKAAKENSKNKKKYVVCLKYGDKYSAEYVNKLHSMVSRNLTIEHEFVCFTENTTGLNKNIQVRNLPLELGISGWWFKPLFFNPALFPDSTILYMDLDIIIFRNIDNLFLHKPTSFCIIRDFNRYLIKNYQKFNSSIFRIESGQHASVYTEFLKNSKSIMNRYPGDQDWIRQCISNDFEFWPDEWIQSYKWEMRGKPRMGVGKNGKKNWNDPGEPIIKPGTSIAVFHGDPNPDECIDPWCKQNWY